VITNDDRKEMHHLEKYITHALTRIPCI